VDTCFPAVSAEAGAVSRATTLPRAPRPYLGSHTAGKHGETLFGGRISGLLLQN